MPSLQGTFALAEVDDVSVVVGQDLHFDVPGSPDEPFQEESVVTESGRCDAPRRQKRGGQVLGPFHHVHTLATAACRWLDQEREADFGGCFNEILVSESGLGDAGNAGNVVGHYVVLGPDLVSHHFDGTDTGSDERDAGSVQRFGERNVLGQEAVARMNGLRSAAAARVNDGVDLQVAVRR
ncbi:hypothetical protein PJL18_03328 [Paenarthrobacter nicotinovorans]|nr:hypothetical protein [Paenarthrobacter nicotinovorans]